MKRVIEIRRSINEEMDGRIELIKQLIPLGLAAVKEVLEFEVEQLVGARYERSNGNYTRWGSNPGSVYLGDQKVSVKVPRVMNKSSGQTQELNSYKKLRSSGEFDERVFKHVINGISMRKYEEVAECIPETFGIKKSSVSRRFKMATAKKLQDLFERDLSKEDIVAIFLDGKSLRSVQVVIALGVTLEGKKIPLGFIETSTENATVCKDFLNGLVLRGLNINQEILFIIDGSKGIHKAITSVFGDKAVIQRCQWHKRENILSYLPKNMQEQFRSKLQFAYSQETYEKAKSKLLAIRKELSLINESAASSLDEGLEETLTLHKLGVFMKAGKSFKTTNCIENLNRQIQIYVNRVSNWKNSNQRRRWIASAILETEKRFKPVEGYKLLPLLRQKMNALRTCNTNMSLAA
jgi:transposase-like protein